jgi:hypothetical protein
MKPIPVPPPSTFFMARWGYRNWRDWLEKRIYSNTGTYSFNLDDSKTIQFHHPKWNLFGGRTTISFPTVVCIILGDTINTKKPNHEIYGVCITLFGFGFTICEESRLIDYTFSVF